MFLYLILVSVSKMIVGASGSTDSILMDWKPRSTLLSVIRAAIVDFPSSFTTFGVFVPVDKGAQAASICIDQLDVLSDIDVFLSVTYYSIVIVFL